MTRNDIFYKVLFAISIALLPIVIFAYLFLPEWSISLIIAGILLCKIWIELFRDKTSLQHLIIDSVASILIFSTLLIFFAVIDMINLALAIVAIVLIVFSNIYKIVFFKKTMPEFINAVDYCYMLFECLTLVAFMLLFYYSLLTNIGLVAIILTAGVSLCYKVYYTFRYTKVNNIFNKFRRKR